MAATKKAAKESSRRSTVIATLFVAAAGAIAWYGYHPSQPAGAEGPDHGQAVTLAAQDTPPVPAVRSATGLPTRVRIESAGIDASIAEVGVVEEADGPQWQTAWRSAGHHIDSSQPGNPGNVVLTGHVSVANPANLAVFANLDLVSVGDIVDVYSGDILHQYRVEDVEVVSPDNVNVLGNDHRSLVTLITCTHDLQNRLVVVGELIT